MVHDAIILYLETKLQRCGIILPILTVEIAASMTMGDPKKRTHAAVVMNDWGTVLLSRINNFFKYETHCDLTLRLCTSQIVKIHRVILHACTDYFDSILSPDTTSLDLDESFPAEIMITIIKFMYTGQVNNISEEIYSELYKMATNLRIQILVDHLDAAKKQDTNSVDVKTITLPAAAPVEVLRPVVTNDNSAPKRLPVWTRKPPPTIIKKPIPCNVPLVLSSNTMIRFVLTKPIPTRFECDVVPGDDFPITIVGDALKFMSYENDLPLNQPLTLDDSIMSERSSSNTTRVSPGKRPREGSDLSHMKEFGQQQKIRNELMMEENEEDVDDPSSPPSDVTPKPILKSVQRSDSETPKRVRFHEESQESSAVFADQTYIPVSTISHTDTKVDKIEYAGSGELLITSHYGKADKSKRVQYSVLQAPNSDSLTEPSTNMPAVDNPAKIVSEVLKKYPDLVSGRRKNIKLKVMTNPPAEGVSTPVNQLKTMKTNPSYIYIKDAGPGELNAEAQPPWICTPCGKDDTPLNFPTYPEFRDHIVSVHNIRVSPKLCEECGQRVPNLNQMIYHKYVRHNIQPPTPNMFPKCGQCSHISQSATLLARHIESAHSAGNLVCGTCNVGFKSQTLYQSHRRSDWHMRRESQLIASCDYPCPFCDAEFTVGAELKSHIEAQHQKKESEPANSEEGKENEVESQSPTEEEISQDQPINETSNASPEIEEIPAAEKIPAEEEVASKEISPSTADEVDSSLPAQPTEEGEEAEEDTEVMEVSEEVQPEVTKPSEPELVEKTDECVPENEATVADESQPNEAEEVFEASEETPAPDFVADQPENAEVYENESVSPELEISFDSNPKSDDNEIEQSKNEFDNETSFSSDNVNNESYEAMEIDETVRTEGMSVDPEIVDNDTDECEDVPVPDGQPETETREGHADHDYAPYNPLVMYPQNVMLSPRVMLVTHPIAHPLHTVFVPAPNIITDPIVLPYPQCTQVQMVNNGQVVSTTAQVVTTSVPTECVQVVRERKVEPETLANDWDESSQTETATQSVLQPGVGPSRAEFF